MIQSRLLLYDMTVQRYKSCGKKKKSSKVFFFCLFVCFELKLKTLYIILRSNERLLKHQLMAMIVVVYTEFPTRSLYLRAQYTLIQIYIYTHTCTNTHIYPSSRANLKFPSVQKSYSCYVSFPPQCIYLDYIQSLCQTEGLSVMGTRKDLSSLICATDALN